jgi:hypothetical protein
MVVLAMPTILLEVIGLNLIQWNCITVIPHGFHQVPVKIISVSYFGIGAIWTIIRLLLMSFRY